MFNLKQIWNGNKTVKIILLSFLVLILTLAIFSAGMFVGFRKARFSYQWGENYHQLFGGRPRQNIMPGIRGDEFINPNGVSGSVIKFTTDTLAVALKLDALTNTHPIEIAVNDPNEIGEIFDAVSYSKGAVVIRMLADYLGEETFRTGLYHNGQFRNS